MSCQPQNNGTIYNPYLGSQGIVAHFNSPPNELEAGREVRIGAVVENKGAHDVDNCMLTLTYNSADFSVPNPSKTLSLEGRSQTAQQGELEPVFWNIKARNPGEDVTSEIGAVVTYSYQTNAFVDVCVDPNIYKQSTDPKSCSPGSISLKNQGAPVAVTRVNTNMFPLTDSTGDVEFTISINDVGSGEVSPGSETESLSVSVFLSGNQISCSPSTVMLENGKGTSKCTTKYNAVNEYKTPLHVKLDYRYKDNIAKFKVRILT